MAWEINKSGMRVWVPSAAEKAAQATTTAALGSNSTQPAGTYANGNTGVVSTSIAPSIAGAVVTRPDWAQVPTMGVLDPHQDAIAQTTADFNLSADEIKNGLAAGSVVPPATTPGLLDGIGGAKGFADIGGGLASLYSIYSGYQQNKRADDALNMQKQEYNRGVQKDKDFATAMNKSGLGSYSAGIK